MRAGRVHHPLFIISISTKFVAIANKAKNGRNMTEKDPVNAKLEHTVQSRVSTVRNK